MSYMSVYVCNCEDTSDKNPSTEDRSDIYLFPEGLLYMHYRNKYEKNQVYFEPFSLFLVIINNFKPYEIYTVSQ